MFTVATVTATAAPGATEAPAAGVLKGNQATTARVGDGADGQRCARDCCPRAVPST